MNRSLLRRRFAGAALASFTLMVFGLTGAATPRYSGGAPVGVGIRAATIAPIREAWPIVREPSGNWGVVGEAVITNSDESAARVKSVTLEVLDTSGSVLGERIYARRRQVGELLLVVTEDASGGLSLKPQGTTRLAPGDRGFALVATLVDGSTAPASASVTVTFRDGRSLATNVPLVEFRPEQHFIWPLSSSGGNWVARGTAGTYHHWRALVIPAAREYDISQRYAIDTTQVDARGRTSNPPSSARKEDYYAWEEDILSAGTGVVVAIESGLPDQEIGSADSNNPAGNHVVVRYGPQLFGVYAHLRQGSASVSVGDIVHAGQVIGKVGNSGNTTEPHLHYHFVDAWEGDVPFYFSQGLPALVSNAQVERDGKIFPLEAATPLEGDIVIAP